MKKMAAILGWCFNLLAGQRGNVGDEPVDPTPQADPANEPEPQNPEPGDDDNGTPPQEPEPEVVPKKALLEERRKRQELERQLQQARNPQPAPQPAAFDTDTFIPPGTPPEPNLDQFEDYASYSREMARWEARRIIAVDRHLEQQNTANRQRQTVLDSHSQRVAAAQEKHQDWDEVFASAPDVQFSDATFAAILDSDQSADITYFLAKNPEEAVKIANMPPHQAVKAIGKLEVKFSSPPPEPKRVSQAPTPINPVGKGGDTGVKDPSKMSDDEWLAHERSRLKASGRLY